MTKQEYYDLLVRSATDGTFPAVACNHLTGKWQCVYRGKREDGSVTKCAVGVLIPDRKYDPSFEWGTVLRLPSDLRAEIQPDGMDSVDLSDVQIAHDCMAVGNGVPIPWDAEAFIRRLNELRCFADVQKVGV